MVRAKSEFRLWHLLGYVAMVPVGAVLIHLAVLFHEATWPIWLVLVASLAVLGWLSDVKRTWGRVSMEVLTPVSVALGLLTVGLVGLNLFEWRLEETALREFEWRLVTLTAVVREAAGPPIAAMLAILAVLLLGHVLAPRVRTVSLYSRVGKWVTRSYIGLATATSFTLFSAVPMQQRAGALHEVNVGKAGAEFERFRVLLREERDAVAARLAAELVEQGVGELQSDEQRRALAERLLAIHGALEESLEEVPSDMEVRMDNFRRSQLRREVLAGWGDDSGEGRAPPWLRSSPLDDYVALLSIPTRDQVRQRIWREVVRDAHLEGLRGSAIEARWREGLAEELPEASTRGEALARAVKEVRLREARAELTNEKLGPLPVKRRKWEERRSLMEELESRAETQKVRTEDAKVHASEARVAVREGLLAALTTVARVPDGLVGQFAESLIEAYAEKWLTPQLELLWGKSEGARTDARAEVARRVAGTRSLALLLPAGWRGAAGSEALRSLDKRLAETTRERVAEIGRGIRHSRARVESVAERTASGRRARMEASKVKRRARARVRGR